MLNKHEKLINDFKSKDKIILDYVKSLGIELGNSFNIELLKRSFVHKSFSNDVHKEIESNERLEFLGDAILGFVVADYLFNEEIKVGEDIMSLYKIALVNETILAEVARDIKAGDYIFLGLGEVNSDGAKKDSVLSDFIEAFIAYLYLDLGEQYARDFIQKYIYCKIDKIKKTGKIKSTKSMLQEYIQSKYKIIPIYKDYENKIDEKGNPIEYKTEVYLEDEILGVGYGPNKKKSQSSAAEKSLKKFGLIK